jgi:hypothetical protein
MPPIMYESVILLGIGWLMTFLMSLGLFVSTLTWWNLNKTKHESFLRAFQTMKITLVSPEGPS